MPSLPPVLLHRTDYCIRLKGKIHCPIHHKLQNIILHFECICHLSKFCKNSTKKCHLLCLEEVIQKFAKQLYKRKLYVCNMLNHKGVEHQKIKQQQQKRMRRVFPPVLLKLCVSSQHGSFPQPPHWMWGFFTTGPYLLDLFIAKGSMFKTFQKVASGSRICRCRKYIYPLEITTW